MENTDKKRVFFVELYHGHSECAYSQLLYLRQIASSITLVCDEQVEDKYESCRSLVDGVIAWDFSNVKNILELCNVARRGKVDLVMLNTASGDRALKFCLVMKVRSPRSAIAGVVHNLNKLRSSIGQKIICRSMKRFYVLGEYLKNSVPRDFAKKCGVARLAFRPFDSVNTNIIKAPDAVWVAIPGEISYARRNYDILLDLAKNKALAPHVKFVLLGNGRICDGPDFFARIDRAMCSDRFVRFDNYVDDTTYNSYLKMSDVLLPIIDKEVCHKNDYSRFKISGTFVISECYGTPMIIDSCFEDVPGFDYPCVFYNSSDEMVELINNSAEVGRQKRSKRTFDECCEDYLAGL